MKTNYILWLLLLTIPFLFTNCDDDNEVATDEYFKAAVGGRGQDCGDTFVVIFREDTARVRAITNNDNPYLVYYADYLPEQYKIADLEIKLKFRNPRRDEFRICTTLGIPWPHIIVEDVLD